MLQALESIRPRVSLGDGRELTASQLCERFGFGGNRQWTFVADLSGGERRRLQLMRLLMGEPNVLLLDEPTNDLDIDTLTALEDLLDGWPGSLVVVSHDRYFVERVCTDVYGLPGDGRIVHLPGGIEQYVEQRRAEQEAALAAAAPARRADDPPARGSVLRQARKDADRLERELGRLNAREAGAARAPRRERDGLRAGGGAGRGAAGPPAAARGGRGGVARGGVAAGGRVAPRLHADPRVDRPDVDQHVAAHAVEPGVQHDREVAVRRQHLDGVPDRGRAALRGAARCGPCRRPRCGSPTRPARPSAPAAAMPAPIPTSSLTPASVMTKPGWAFETTVARTVSDGVNGCGSSRRSTASA